MKNKTTFLEWQFFKLMMKHSTAIEYKPHKENPDAGRGVWRMEIPKWLSNLIRVACRMSASDLFQKVCDEADGVES